MWTSIELDVECIVCNKTLQKINHDPHGVPFKMRKITSRRSRTPNWSLEEKKYLLDLIKERKEIVVNKSCNNPNNYEEKDVAWKDILRELALKFGTKFTGFSIKKLKTQWQNMKRIAREEISLNGAAVENYTKQSFEVCNILELVKDGILKKEENEQFNEPILKTNIEIKTECIDEDMNEPSSSDVSNMVESQPETIDTTAMDSLSSSASGQIEINETRNDITLEETVADSNKTAQTMTEPSTNFDINMLPKEFHDFISYSSTEKEVKLEYLKEERQIIRAMRETAELNKIIAEQKLKHVLWVKKQEMSMYSGEPGSGAGKGGGGGGAIREAGGSFGKMEAAREDEYFYKKQKEQLSNLKSHMEKEVAFHQEQIKRHEDAIRRHKQTMSEMSEKM